MLGFQLSHCSIASLGFCLDFGVVNSDVVSVCFNLSRPFLWNLNLIFCLVFQRNLDQLETLSKKLKAKTLRNEAPQQSIAATRYRNDFCHNS